MKHLAVRCRSTASLNPYTAPGLGDRVHTLTCAWAYANAYHTPVTVHVDRKKTVGGQFGNKTDSWNEIAALFPRDVHWKAHKVEPASETEWMGYLAAQGIDAEMWGYHDFPGKYQTGGFDIAPLLARIPLLDAAPRPVNLPAQYVTEQWDANAEGRRLHPHQQSAVRARYGDKVTIGGGAKGGLRSSLKDIAYALSRADLHVGVDSGFMHLAMLYLPFDRLHLYRRDDGYDSHHMKRARANGAAVHDIV